jgi:hypothetical protein
MQRSVSTTALIILHSSLRSLALVILITPVLIEIAHATAIAMKSIAYHTIPWWHHW